MNKEVNFEWYVFNDYEHRGIPDQFNDYPYSCGGYIRPYNIFNNIKVYDSTIKLCKDFKRKKMALDEFTEELRKIIMWQEWGRCEYEINVSGLFSDKANKIDCYLQALPNIKIIAQYVLHTYYPRLKLKEE